MFKKMLTFTALNLRILNKILRDLYGQFYALHLEVLYITPGLEGSSFLPHLALEEELLVPRHPVEGLAGPHLGPVHVAPDPGGRGLDVAQRHAHAYNRHESQASSPPVPELSLHSSCFQPEPKHRTGFCVHPPPRICQFSNRNYSVVK